VPVTGERRSVKVFGCVEVFSARFLYRRDSVFNAETYLGFLQQIDRRYEHQPVVWVQDNASYHRHSDVKAWFEDRDDRWTVVHLPPYSPELNAEERLWHHTRITGTHNRYFATKEELHTTLTTVFRNIQRCPDQIRGYLAPFT
jgi:transposase